MRVGESRVLCNAIAELTLIGIDLANGTEYVASGTVDDACPWQTIAAMCALESKHGAARERTELTIHGETGAGTEH